MTTNKNNCKLSEATSGPMDVIKNLRANQPVARHIDSNLPSDGTPIGTGFLYICKS